MNKFTLREIVEILVADKPIVDDELLEVAKYLVDTFNQNDSIKKIKEYVDEQYEIEFPSDNQDYN